MDLGAIQTALIDAGLDGWLFYDFRGSDPLAAAVLGLPRDRIRSRRWFYFIPARGEPTQIVHAVEPGALEGLPGARRVYLPWRQLHEHLRQTLAGSRRVAMQYSPLCAVPYVARADAGTVELVRACGVEVVSSADLVAKFEAVFTDRQRQMHMETAERLGRIVMEGFAEIGRRVRAGTPTTEWDVQRFLWKRFADCGLTADHPPTVAVDANSADPHYCPVMGTAAAVTRDCFVLIDAWCKMTQPGAVYADITWTGWVGRSPPEEHRRVFTIVRDARDAAVAFLRKALAAGTPVTGAEVDDACRAVIRNAGFGERFIHRTGHSIHENIHGNGANIDNLETEDRRRLIPRTCFSIEPGIYLPGRFGVRSEIDVYLQDERTAVVTGIPAQQELLTVE